MKIIEYMGHEFEVPEWAKFIATDEDGDIYVYDTMPELYEEGYGFGCWYQDRNNGRGQLVVNRRWNWQETLVEIEE